MNSVFDDLQIKFKTLVRCTCLDLLRNCTLYPFKQLFIRGHTWFTETYNEPIILSSARDSKGEWSSKSYKWMLQCSGIIEI